MTLQDVGVRFVTDGAGAFFRTTKQANEAVESFGEATTKSAGMVEGFSSRASTAFSDVATVAASATLAATAAVGAGIAAAAAVAFNAANDINNSAMSIQSELGTTADEAKKLADIAADAWGNNFAGSIEEAGGVISLVRQQLGDLSDQELQRVTENAFRLADTFEIDTAEAINTVKVLMSEFGLTSEEAFDFVTTGFQRGLDASGDFTDSIGEYSNLFGDAGFSADQFFNLLETGQAGGVLGVDKIADAVKEMNIILMEGGSEAAEAFEQVTGQSFERVEGFIRSGDEAWADYFPNILEGLQSIEDPLERNRLQVAIFGTMAEDLGVSFTEGLSTAGIALEDMAGKTAALDVRYQTLEDVVEGFKRRAVLALVPIGEVVLSLANEAMPLVNQAFATFESVAVPAIENIAQSARVFIADFKQGIESGNNSIVNFVAKVQEIAAPIADIVTRFISWKDVLLLVAGVIGAVVINAIAGIVIALAPVVLAVGAVIAAVALLRTAWEENWGGIQEKAQAVIDFIVPLVNEAITSIQAWWAENGSMILLGAQETWNGIMEAINLIIEALTPIVSAFLNTISEYWTQHGDQVVLIVTTLANAVIERIKGMFETFALVFAAFRSAFEGDWRAFGENLALAFINSVQSMVDFLASLWSLVQPIIQLFIDNIIFTFTGVDWAGVGGNIARGIAAGLAGAAGAIVEAAKAAVTAAIDAAKAAAGIESPSKEGIKIGKLTDEGIKLGLLEDIPTLIDAGQRVSEAVLASIGSTMQGSLSGSSLLNSVQAMAPPALSSQTTNTTINNNSNTLNFASYPANSAITDRDDLLTALAGF